MASFTDQIMQSRPYVQQLPLEAMAQVGAYKQQKYEEGVQKVQSQIDNVAGLDVAKDIDKQYLQSKLNQLGSKLKTVAAGDFSNFQLVNSVGGMTNQIVKDKNVQNAVSSTAWYRRQIADIEAARKEGKSSASNIFDFNEQAHGWLNDNTPGQVFNGVYTPYRDVNKKVIDVIGKLHPKITTEDIAYGKNPDGSINTRKILDAMHRKGIETVDEGQIRTAINSVLDADDYNQLAIDGKFNLRGVDQNQLVKTADGEYIKSKQDYTSQLERQKKQLLNTTDINQQAIINGNIKYYEEMLGDPSKGIVGKLDENHNSILQSISKNPNDAKGRIYTKNYLDQIANGFAWANVKDEILSNPVKENFWKQKEFEFKQMEHADLQDYRKSELVFKAADLSLKKKEFDAKYGPTTPYFKRTGDPTTDELTSLENYTAYNNKLDNDNQAILTDLAGKNSSINTKLTPNDILSTITKYKDGTYNPTKYEKEQMDTYIANENLLANQKAMYETYENQARQELGVGKEVQNALSTRGNLAIGGYTFTPKEVYSYLKKERSALTSIPTPMGSVPYQGISIDDAQLNSKERALKSILTARYDPRNSLRSSGNAKLDKYLADFSPVLNQGRNLDANVQALVAKKLAPVTGQFATEQASITFKDENSKKQFIGDLTNIAKADLDQKTGAVKYNPKKVIELFTKKAAVDIETELRRAGGDYYIQVTDKADPKSTELIKVDADFVARNPHLGANYINTNLDLAELMLRNNGTTNIFKDKAHATYQTGKFGSYDNTGSRTVTLPVAADLDLQGGELYPTFHLKTKSHGDINYKYPLSTDKTDFETKYLPSLTNEKIIKLFKSQYPNIEQLIQE